MTVHSEDWRRLTEIENQAWIRWRRRRPGETPSSAHFHGFLEGYAWGWEDGEKYEDPEDEDDSQ